MTMTFTGAPSATVAAGNLARFLDRNADRFGPPGSRLYLNPPPDLQVAEPESALFTQNFSVHRALSARGASIEFGELPPGRPAHADHFILCQPRERALLELWLRWVVSALPRMGTLWLAGENRAGARSAGSMLEGRFERWSRCDSARHCVLYQAASPRADLPAGQVLAFEDWSESVRGQELAVSSLPGVFAHGRLDAGTRLLLETLEFDSLRGSILDIGCGSGVISAAVKRFAPGAEVVGVDNHALALAATRRTLSRNGLAGEAVASDGFSGVSGTFRAIISNPPFHEGHRTEPELSLRMMEPVRNFLAPGGQLLLVVNRHLPYRRWLDSRFGASEVLADDGRYQVLRALLKPD